MLKAIFQNRWIRRGYMDRTETERILLLSFGFSALLLVIRMLVTGSLFYGFLAWNLFLAYVPYAITGRLAKKQKPTGKFLFGIIFICWLLFIPNSFYIITDLFHLEQGTAAPQWYDLVLIFSFAWVGLLLGILSIRAMQRVFELSMKVKANWIFIYSIMWLNALGIYIGRYLRFNSWDVIVSPVQLAGDILYLCMHPLRNQQEWGMIICFFVLLTLMYKSIRNVGKAFF